MTNQTTFGAMVPTKEYDVDLKDLDIVELSSLENKTITIDGAFTAESKKWVGSKYAVLLLPNKKFTMGGSVIAGQVAKFKEENMKYPATAIILKRTSKKTGKDYFILG